MGTLESTQPILHASTSNSVPSIMQMDYKILKQIIKTIGIRKAESGGAIGGLEKAQKIDIFHFDQSSKNSAVTYSPDHHFLNRLFEEEWNPNGIRLKGFIHSHPGQISKPSYGDQLYARRILDAIDDLHFL